MTVMGRCNLFRLCCCLLRKTTLPVASSVTTLLGNTLVKKQFSFDLVESLLYTFLGVHSRFDRQHPRPLEYRASVLPYRLEDHYLQKRSTLDTLLERLHAIVDHSSFNNNKKTVYSALLSPETQVSSTFVEALFKLEQIEQYDLCLTIACLINKPLYVRTILNNVPLNKPLHMRCLYAVHRIMSKVRYSDDIILCFLEYFGKGEVQYDALLIIACLYGRTKVVAFLLQCPAIHPCQKRFASFKNALLRGHDAVFALLLQHPTVHRLPPLYLPNLLQDYVDTLKSPRTVYRAQELLLRFFGNFLQAPPRSVVRQRRET
jgi:hypothetical protein